MEKRNLLQQANFPSPQSNNRSRKHSPPSHKTHPLEKALQIPFHKIPKSSKTPAQKAAPNKSQIFQNPAFPSLNVQTKQRESRHTLHSMAKP